MERVEGNEVKKLMQLEMGREAQILYSVVGPGRGVASAQKEMGILSRVLSKGVMSYDICYEMITLAKLSLLSIASLKVRKTQRKNQFYKQRFKCLKGRND